MIGPKETGFAENSIFTGNATTGLTVTTLDGQPAMLAVLDKHGRVIDRGLKVAKDAFGTSVNIHRNFLIGQGYLKVHSKPPE